MRLSRRCTTGVFKGGMILEPDAAAQLQFYSYTRSSSYKWLAPLAVAILFHGLVLYLSLYSPMQLFRRPKPVEVMTVNLFRVTDMNNQTIRSVSPPVGGDVIPKKRTGPPISLAPQKTKKINIRSKTEKRKRENILDKRIASIRAEQEAKKAKEVAKSAIQEQLARMVKDKYGSTDASTTTSTGPSSLTATQNAYVANIKIRFMDNWILPDLSNWNKELEAIVVVKVDRHGKIIKSFFEKKTDNAYFNKFVEKTIKKTDPLPPLPDDFQEEVEFGLIFRPGEIL